MNFTAKMKDIFKEYNYLIVCFFCFVISLLGIWIGKWAFVAYACVIVGCSFFYDVNKMIVLCSFSIFLLSLFDFWSEILIFFASLSVICFKKVVFEKKKITKDLILPIALTCVLLILFFAVNFEFQNIRFVSRYILLMLVLVEAYFLRDDFDVLKIARWLCILFVLSCIISTPFIFISTKIKVIHVDSVGIKRFIGLMGHENVTAMISILLLTLLLQFFIKKRISNLELILLSVPLIMVGVFTKGKLFILLLAILTIIYFVALYMRNVKLGLIETGVVLMCFAVVLLVYPKFVAQYVSRFFSYLTDGSLLDMLTTGRVSLWKQHIELWLSSPLTILFGIGGAKNLSIIEAHNDYIEILTRYGIVGFMCIAVIICYLCHKLRKRLKFDIKNYILLIFVLIVMMFDPFIQEKAVFILLGIMMIYNRKIVYVENNKKMNGGPSKKMNEDLKVSVIVPIYNVEEYLKRCLDSIVGQTYYNLEIILVDDGSPDNCPKICDDYAKVDSRIKVIHKKNGGLMDAWMTGLSQCTADYVSFVDSDDWCEFNMIEKLMAPVVENSAELVIGNFYDSFKTKKNKMYCNRDRIVGLYKGEKLDQIKRNVIDMPNSYIPLFRWNKLFKKELLINNLKYCNPKITMYEDVCVTQGAILDAKNIYFISDFIYNYFFREGSMIHKYSDKMVDKCELYLKTYEKMIKEKTSEYESGMIFERVRLAYSIAKTIIYNPLKNKNKLLKNFCASEIIRGINIKHARKVLTNERYILAKAFVKGRVAEIRFLYFCKKILGKIKGIKSRLRGEVIIFKEKSNENCVH